jgi:hypothetical protein
VFRAQPRKFCAKILVLNLDLFNDDAAIWNSTNSNANELSEQAVYRNWILIRALEVSLVRTEIKLIF